MTEADRDRLVTLQKAKKKLITQREAAEELGMSERQVRRRRRLNARKPTETTGCQQGTIARARERREAKKKSPKIWQVARESEHNRRCRRVIRLTAPACQNVGMPIYWPPWNPH